MECGFGEDIWAKKGLPAADSYGRVSPKQSPRWPPQLFCMLNKTSPRLELSLCAWDAEPKYRTFQSCTDWIDFAGRGKVSVRISSAAGIRVHGQLAICTLQCRSRSPQVKRKMLQSKGYLGFSKNFHSKILIWDFIGKLSRNVVGREVKNLNRKTNLQMYLLLDMIYPAHQYLGDNYLRQHRCDYVENYLCVS